MPLYQGRSKEAGVLFLSAPASLEIGSGIAVQNGGEVAWPEGS